MNKILATNQLIQEIDQFYSLDSDFRLVSLCTPDGFGIYQTGVDEFQSEPDKIAAIASTLSSISNSIANEIIHSAFNVTFIEADGGNFVCVFTKYLQHNVVLIIYADKGMSLGVLRVKTKGLANVISELST